VTQDAWSRIEALLGLPPSDRRMVRLYAGPEAGCTVTSYGVDVMRLKPGEEARFRPQGEWGIRTC
jgi:hypothetical protein